MVGRFVVPALTEAGFTVRGQYRRTPGKHPQVDWRQCDFSGEVAWEELVEGCQAVIHLAAELHNIEVMHRVNVDTTRLLAKAAAAQGGRYFSHASSIVVYGSPRKRDVDEQSKVIDPGQPLDRQYRAELSCENMPARRF
jgi:nucleoside-diphosphate-sugar epimerase